MNNLTGMIPRGRGHSSNRGGRGYIGKSPNPNNILVQYGNKKLIASDISRLSQTSTKELEEFKKWKELQSKDDNPSSSTQPSFANVIQPDHMYVQNGEERVILLLNDKDKKWAKEPQILYDRYLGPHGYTMEAYKSRTFYEQILIANGCEFTHFSNKNKEKQEIYNFSKILIKKIIYIEDWGISPFREKTLTNSKGATINYNYWDYIQAFEKIFCYENPSLSHTWFIKIYPEVYNFPIPSWLINWWSFYGTWEEILPDFLKEYYDEWVQVKPDNEDDHIIPNNMRFFIEYSIPWIWKFKLETGYTKGIFCLKRIAQTRFWEKMIRNDDEGQLFCLPTINLLKEKIDSYKNLLEHKKTLQMEERINFLTKFNDDSCMDVNDASEEEIIQAYVLSLKKVLQTKKEDDKKSSTSDFSMASDASGVNHEIFQDSQQIKTEDIDNKDSIESQVRRFLYGGTD